MDLTTAERFFHKSEYYTQQGVNVEEVRRFTKKEAARLLLDEGIAFWGFDLKRYASVSAWPTG